jgi:hypothetical protein
MNTRDHFRVGQALPLLKAVLGFNARSQIPSRLIQVVLSGVLVVAATLKVSGIAFDASNIITTAFVAGLEYGFAVWLVLGRPIWLVSAFSVLLFSFFAIVSSAKAISGEESCGCFGSVGIHPWYTFAFDIISVASLLVSWPLRSHVRVRFGVAMLLLSFAVGILLVGITNQARREVSMSDPYRWTGRRWPVLPFIKDRSQLNRGAWLVLLYRGNCKECLAVIDEIVERDRSLMGSLRLALVNVSDAVLPTELREAASLRGLLTEVLPALPSVKTPTILILSDGIVESVGVLEPTNTLLWLRMAEVNYTEI